MSRINVFGDEQYFGEILPGYHLVRLVNTIPDPEEIYKEGMWGLTHCNDPDFVFYQNPLPVYSLGNEDDESIEDVEGLDDVADHYQDQLYGSIQECHRLWDACLRAGYDPEKHGYNLAYWLLNCMFNFLESVEWKPKQISDRL
jgi:hypothetical protein